MEETSDFIRSCLAHHVGTKQHVESENRKSSPCRVWADNPILAFPYSFRSLHHTHNRFQMENMERMQRFKWIINCFCRNQFDQAGAVHIFLCCCETFETLCQSDHRPIPIYEQMQVRTYLSPSKFPLLPACRLW